MSTEATPQRRRQCGPKTKTGCHTCKYVDTDLTMGPIAYRFAEFAELSVEKSVLSVFVARKQVENVTGTARISQHQNLMTDKLLLSSNV
jgi:hypothetical protein